MIFSPYHQSSFCVSMSRTRSPTLRPSSCSDSFAKSCVHIAILSMRDAESNTETRFSVPGLDTDGERRRSCLRRLAVADEITSTIKSLCFSIKSSFIRLAASFAWSVLPKRLASSSPFFILLIAMPLPARLLFSIDVSTRSDSRSLRSRCSMRIL